MLAAVWMPDIDEYWYARPSGVQKFNGPKLRAEALAEFQRAEQARGWWPYGRSVLKK
jgi:hypothetical protein